MRGERLSAVELLDEAARLTRRTAAPWLGVLWLTAIPYHLLQVNFYYHVLQLGHNAKHYGDFLSGLAWLTVGAWLLALYGRLAFVRACLQNPDRPERLGWVPLRPPLAEWLTYLYLAVIIEFLFHLLFLSFIFVPVLVLLAGLAPAVAYGQGQPAPLKSLLVLGRAAISTAGLWWLLILLLALLFVTWINLYLACRAGIWLASGVGGFDVSAWNHLLRPTEEWPWPALALPRLLLLAGSLLLLEPFWLASHAVAVQRLRSRETGEDLRTWFRGLRQQREAP